jgi:peptidoglycan lytic transglycosylase D
MGKQGPIIGFMLLWSVATAMQTQAQGLDMPEFPGLISSVRLKNPQNFCGEAVDLDNPEVRERFEKELLLTIWDRPQVILWLKRSKRYLPIIEQMLREAGLPDDLKYVTVAESALRPHAGSPKGAMGFWQFTTATARKYGLTVDSKIDARRDIFKSTQAAILYFEQLYEQFGSWTLAAAAYNMGEQGLQSEILAQKTSNYYHLYLPLETQRYIFRILSAKMILSNPQKYGFKMEDSDFYAPLEFDRITVDCFQETPIQLIAEAAGTYFKIIKDLNPEIRGHYVAAGSHSLLIPKDAGGGFHERFKALVDQWVAKKEERVYVVEAGDNLSLIADRFRVPLQALLIWNQLDYRKPIHPGQRLIIYPGTVAPLEDLED